MTDGVTIDLTLSGTDISAELEIKGVFDNDSDATANGVILNEIYELSTSNTYGLPEGLLKKRKN